MNLPINKTTNCWFIFDFALGGGLGFRVAISSWNVQHFRIYTIFSTAHIYSYTRMTYNSNDKIVNFDFRIQR